MATWVRQGTGTAPSATDADLVGDYALDNATAPADFDPAAVASVQCQWTITGSGFVDDSWSDNTGVAVETGATEISQHLGGGSTGLQNTSVNNDHTDSTGVPTGLTTTQWEAALVRGDGAAIPDEWVSWVKVKGPDGFTLAASALTVTITYTPAAAGPNEGSATGSISWPGSADGAATHEGSNTGSVTWAGSADGAVDHEGSSTGSITWAGSATGEAPTGEQNEGSATGAVTWIGAVTGEATHEGSAVGSITWVGFVASPARRTTGATRAILLNRGISKSLIAKTGKARAVVDTGKGKATLRSTGASTTEGE